MTNAGPYESSWTHRCPRCGVSKDLDQFYGRRPGWCIQCRRENNLSCREPRRCVVCDVELPRGKGAKKYCSAHHPQNQPRRPRLSDFKQDRCEDCGFPGHGCQLDVRCMDGDKTNWSPSNLRTVCANCGRLYGNGVRSNLHLTEDEQTQLERFLSDVR